MKLFQAGNLRTVSESEEPTETESANPPAPNTAPLRRKKKGGLGLILNWLKGDQNKRAAAENKAAALGK